MTQLFWRLVSSILSCLQRCSAVVVALLCPAVLSADPIKVATFNLLHGGVFSGVTGDDQNLEHRLEMVVAEFQKHHLDIIGIQEASSSRRRGNTAARLAAALGFHYVYAPASFRIFRNEYVDTFVSWLMNFDEGPAIISRFPITAWETHDLPRCGRLTDPRVLLAATVRTPQGPVLVASTHTSGDPCQHQHVVEILRRMRGNVPALVMGDFNASEHSPAMAMFTREHGFIDAYRMRNRNLPGATCYQRPFAATQTASRRIDYLFVISEKAATGQIHTSKVFLDAPRQLPNGQTLWPSDHYGVFAEVSIFSQGTIREVGNTAGQ